jgi:asparagine synthase (glutamine-hydrolysing)
MPGIYGYVKSDVLSEDFLLKQKERASYFSHFKHDILFLDANICASRTHTGITALVAQPLTSEGVYIWGEGDIYNTSELASKIGVSSSDFLELLLIAYNKNKLEEVLNIANGYFSVVIYDAVLKKIKLITDRFGLRFLYWTVANENFIWGSEVKYIAEAAELGFTFNKSSFEVFTDLGYLLDDSTWFEEIKLLPPSSILTYDITTKSHVIDTYWKWSEIKPSNLSFDEAVDELGRCFLRAVKKRFDPTKKIGIALSGGLDSRAILAAVDYLYPDYQGYTYTFGIEGCEDIGIAQQAANAVGWKHESFLFTNDDWFSKRVAYVWYTDGMQDFKHMHGCEFWECVSKNIDYNLNGFSGDAIFGGGFLNKTPFNKRADLENTKAFYGKHADVFNFEHDFFGIDKVEPHLQMNRVRRFTTMGSVSAQTYVEQLKPFFDNECVELVYSLPDEFRANNKVYSAMLIKFFPKLFASIKWQKTGLPLSRKTHLTFWDKVYKRLKVEISKMIGKPFSGEYVDYNAWISDERVSSKIEELFKSSLNKDRVDGVLDNYLNKHLAHPGKDFSCQILRRLTVEIYLSHYEKNR